MHVYIEDIGKHEGEEVTIKGWLHNRRSSGKIHFLTLRDGTRLHPGRDVEGRGRRRACSRPPIICRRKPRSSSPARRAPTRARPSGYEIDVKTLRGRRRVARLPDHAEGARRRLPARPPASVDPQRAAAGDPARPPRNHQRRPRLLQRPRLHPRRHADLHAGRVRRHDDALPGAVLRRPDGVPDAERPALQRSQRDGARPRLLLRPDVPRREVEDAPPPDRVLDGRAGDGVRRPRRRDGPRRRARRLGRRARARDAAARADGARARHRRKLEVGAGAVSAHHLRRGGEDAARTKGLPFEWGGDFGGPDETALSEQFDRPGDGAPLSRRGQGVLHEARPRARRASRSASTCSRRKATARSSAAASASPISTCCCSASRNTTCRRKRSSGISTCGATARVPHGGFGMGIERVVAWICGLEHVRETIPYPRMLYRLYP